MIEYFHRKSISLIENEEKGLLFERFYKVMERDLRFQMKLTVHSEGETKVHESETSLTPLLREEFVSIINSSLFTKYNLYGNFSMSDHTKDSPALVVVLSKE